MSVALVKTFENLPYIPRKMFVQHLNMLELIDLSLISPAIKNVTRNFRLAVSEFKWIIKSPGHFVIHITPKDPNQPKIIFKLAQGSTLKFCTGYLADEKVKIARNQRAFTIKCSKNLNEKIQLFDKLTRNLLDMLSVEEFNFDSTLYTNFVFKHTRKFETFILSHEKLSLAQTIFLFENIKVDTFKLDYVQVGIPGLQYKFALNHRKIIIHSVNWLCFSSILDMKCEMLKINFGGYTSPSYQKPRFKHSDFILFARNWLNGKIKNLKEFKVFFEHETTESAFYSARRELLSELNDGGAVNHDGRVQRNDGKTSQMELHYNYFHFELME